MIKAGLIGGVVGFIYVASLTLLSPVCTLCFTPLLGIGVGYLAGWFDKPPTVNVSLSRGIIAGNITGVGVIAGQILATVISAVLITNLEQLPPWMRQFLQSESIVADLTISSFFCSLINLGIITGLGALGGMLWFRRQGHALSTLSS
jgi:hypothetical protein